jgi:hypothetical protein
MTANISYEKVSFNLIQSKPPALPEESQNLIVTGVI